MKFLREMISRKSETEEAPELYDEGFEVPEEDQETLRGLREKLADAPAVSATDEDADDMADGVDDDDILFDDEQHSHSEAEGDEFDDEEWEDDFEGGFEDDQDDEDDAGYDDPEISEEEQHVPEPVAADSDDEFEDEMEFVAEVDETEPSDDGWEEMDEDTDEFVPINDSHHAEDGADDDGDNPMAELTQDDIQRAMKLRKKMWSDVPTNEELASTEIEPSPEPAPQPTQSDLETYRPASRAVTRPVTRPTTRPSSKPFREVSDTRNHAPVEETPSPVAQVATELEADAPTDVPAASEASQPEIPVAPHAIEPQVEAPADDDATVQSLMAAAAAAKAKEPDFPEEFEDVTSIADVAAPAVGRGGRRAGRVKTRLLGFQADETADKDIFDADTNKPGQPDQFPVAWIVVVDGPGRGSSFSLRSGVSLIGRGEDQAVRLDFGDTSISRNNHATVAFDDEMNQFFLGHGGKSNIVRLNNKPVLSTEELSTGDMIRIGETTLRFAALCGGDFNWSEGHGGEADRAAIA